MITTLAPVETRLAENPPTPRHQINAPRGKETPARRRHLTAFIGEYDVPHRHKCIGNSDSYLASQVIVATSGKTQCIVVCCPRLTAGGNSIAATTLMLSSISTGRTNPEGDDRTIFPASNA